MPKGIEQLGRLPVRYQLVLCSGKYTACCCLTSARRRRARAKPIVPPNKGKDQGVQHLRLFMDTTLPTAPDTVTVDMVASDILALTFVTVSGPWVQQLLGP